MFPDMTVFFWIGFLFLIAFFLALDLGVFHKRDREPSMRDSLVWTAIWIIVALIFSGFIYVAYQNHWLGLKDGKTAALEFLTGYLIEKSLSLDNIFVITMIFGYFNIPGKYQHRVLFWGILGAIVLRAIMILAGTTLVSHFSWFIYVLGALLIITAGRMATHKNETIDPEKSWILSMTRKFFPLTPVLHGARFFIRDQEGKLAMTPLFLALILIENTDILFAIDSIPAIFAITTDPFLVFTSNIFAILGLRSLYFTLYVMLNRFHMLKYSLILILAYVGVKMLISGWIHIPTIYSLLAITSALIMGIALSLHSPALGKSL